MAKPEDRTYKVQPGDTLSDIATSYNLDVASLVVSNKLKSADQLRIGQQLSIPAHAVTSTEIKAYEGSRQVALADVPAETGEVSSTQTLTWPSPQSVYVSNGFNYLFHPGIDIAGTYGIPIVAAMSGTVSLNNQGNMDYGMEINITSGNWMTKYAHLSRFLVSNGAHVNAGDTIGLEGSTGNSTGPHLHFAVYINGRVVDPNKYLVRR